MSLAVFSNCWAVQHSTPSRPNPLMHCESLTRAERRVYKACLADESLESPSSKPVFAVKKLPGRYWSRKIKLCYRGKNHPKEESSPLIAGYFRPENLWVPGTRLDARHRCSSLRKRRSTSGESAVSAYQPICLRIK